MSQLGTGTFLQMVICIHIFPLLNYLNVSVGLFMLSSLTMPIILVFYTIELRQAKHAGTNVKILRCHFVEIGITVEEQL